jgi:hypothetical protein
MQPQTMNAPTIAQKIQICVCCIVVFSIARHHRRAIIDLPAHQVLRTNSGSLAMFAAIRRAFMIYFVLSPRIEAVLAQKTRIDMPSINERDAAMARAIFKESEELKDVLEKELLRLENNETFDANEFQKGIVRALIDLFRMVNGLASIAAQ